MKVFSKGLLGIILAFSLCTNHVAAANHTSDVNGWGYTEIREATLLPVLVPLGIAVIMMTVAYIVEQTSGHHNHSK